MYPPGFVTKNHTAVDNGRGSPNRCACLVLPNKFAFVSSQAIEVMVTCSDVHFFLENNRAGPDANVLIADPQMAAVVYELPNQLAGSGRVATNHAIFGCRVHKAVRHCRRRIRICANARFPNEAAIDGVDAIQVTALSPEVDSAIVNCDAAFY